MKNINVISKMTDLQALKNQLSKIDNELLSLLPVDISDFKAVYSRQRRLDHLKREKSRLEILIELEVAEI